MRPINALLTALSVVAWTTTAVAHHSFAAEFDGNKPVTLKGPVRKVEWRNPHIWIYLDVREKRRKAHTLAMRRRRAQRADAARVDAQHLQRSARTSSSRAGRPRTAPTRATPARGNSETGAWSSRGHPMKLRVNRIK
jgi:hypothetical protein